MSEVVDSVREVARRAAGRVRASAGQPTFPAKGIHVQVRSGVLAPGPLPERSKQPNLVELQCLERVPDGGTLAVGIGAQVTPLAQEEAFRRGITLVPTDPGSHKDSAFRVAIGCDHGGLALKREVLGMLSEMGYSTVDMGTCSEMPCDYPDYAAAVAREVGSGRAAMGIVIDGAGIGSAMAANKVPGVLAANCWDAASAANAREHNHANVLSLGAGRLDLALTHEIMQTFFSTQPGAGRHERRAKKIRALDPSHPSVVTH